MAPRTHALLFFLYGRRTMAGTSCSVFNVLLYLNDCTSVFFLSNRIRGNNRIVVTVFSPTHRVLQTVVNTRRRRTHCFYRQIVDFTVMGIGDNNSSRYYGHAPIIPDGFVITPPTIDLRTSGIYLPGRESDMARRRRSNYYTRRIIFGLKTQT